MDITFVLVRHGETEWNRLEKRHGHVDIPLNETGRKQAEKLSERLATTNIKAIYTSDLKRSKETAKIINQKHGVEIIEDPLLREINLGDFEGLSREEAKQKFPVFWEKKKQDPYKFQNPNGESYKDLERRVESFLEKVKDIPNPIPIVSHQATIRTMIGYVLKLEKKEMLDIAVPQNAIYFIDAKKPEISYSQDGLMKKGLLKRENY